ncbi:hypothetical protein [Modicisalibacter luteus]|uniref:Uncharacterized protein n=1 Tax=Modicisalibacter luteus TaxID=453962 RepID=A0ABV7M3J0_9GAMM|nr:hypothetical protein [Halomonas lutea]
MKTLNRILTMLATIVLSALPLTASAETSRKEPTSSYEETNCLEREYSSRTVEKKP